MKYLLVLDIVITNINVSIFQFVTSGQLLANSKLVLKIYLNINLISRKKKREVIIAYFIRILDVFVYLSENIYI